MSEREPEQRVLEVEEQSMDDGVDLVVLHGELDFASGGPLSTVLATLTDGPRRVVVDLERLEFVDSSGVRMLVAAARAVEDSRGVFVLAAPSGPVRRVFDILHLGDVVTIVDDRGAAMALVTSVRSNG